MPRLFSRIAVVLLLSVATLGGWGARVAAMAQEPGCSHMGGSPAAMAAHDAMAHAGQTSAVRTGGAMDAMSGMEEGASCCAPASDGNPPAPCSMEHGAMPCGTAQACATASALRATTAAVPVASMPAHMPPVATAAARFTGPVIAPDVPPPRADSPFRS